MITIKMKNNVLGFLFFAIAAYLPQTCLAATIFEAPEDPFLDHARQATVFIAREVNYYEAAYGSDTYTVFKPFRYFYEWLYPSELGSGSGFLISSDGYIVTNEHVIRGATSVVVVLQDPEFRVCKAKIVGSDRRADVAVIKLEGTENKELPYLKLGDSCAVQVGDPVVVLGTPKYTMLECTVTKGIVSGIDRIGFIPDEIEGYIQTDASVNSGNSGGPMINSKGEVIGMATWTYSHFLGNEGLGFCVNGDTIQCISEQLIKKGKTSQGFLGVELDVTQEILFNNYHFDPNDGAYVLNIIKDSPAMTAGLQSGDMIIQINDCEIISARAFKKQNLDARTECTSYSDC